MYSSPHISMMTMRGLISSEDAQSVHQMTASCSPDKASDVLISSNSYQKSLRGVIFKKTILLEYCCFIILHYFLLNNKMNQLYVHIYPLFFWFPSQLGHHRALRRVPCAICGGFSSVVYFIHNSVHIPIPSSQCIPPPPSLVSIHLFSMSVCLFLLCK